MVTFHTGIALSPLLLFLSVAPVAGAVNPHACTFDAVTRDMRPEGFTELGGDMVLSCTGGIPTAAGQNIPLVTLTVYSTAPITSRLIDAADSSHASEAMLMVDDPGSTSNSSPQVIAAPRQAAP